jgi:hypothetical protein
MRTKKLFPILLVALFLSGCVVYSFYPLYTAKDLFPNEILTGTWTDSDSTVWKFEHPTVVKDGIKSIDKTSFELHLKQKDESEFDESRFLVHIVKLGGNYFLDFYLTDMQGKSKFELNDFHIIPVHTFARLTVKNNELLINWFDQNWLNELIRQNKIRIHHESNDEFVLLTAKPGELQKFVTKYVNSEEAFKDGLSVNLTRNR